GYAWIEQALLLPELRIVELTPKIAYQSTILPKPIHDDPVDQILIATARDENAFVLTKDKLIQNYSHIKYI
ncbi:MAG: type II toxin-antitoxin system VapC family toxin, partial [Deltaproteobacteria bacterium]|nr:type II toxin-antitoxin system VapC family toxin [Deltaproteobacteria bacterium]